MPPLHRVSLHRTNETACAMPPPPLLHRVSAGRSDPRRPGRRERIGAAVGGRVGAQALVLRRAGVLQRGRLLQQDLQALDVPLALGARVGIARPPPAVHAEGAPLRRVHVVRVHDVAQLGANPAACTRAPRLSPPPPLPTPLSRTTPSGRRETGTTTKRAHPLARPERQRSGRRLCAQSSPVHRRTIGE